MTEKLPSANLRFEWGEYAAIQRVVVQVGGEDVAEIPMTAVSSDGIQLKAGNRNSIGEWTLTLLVDLNDGGDPLHKTWDGDLSHGR